MHKLLLSCLFALLSLSPALAIITPVPLEERVEGADQIVHARLDHSIVYAGPDSRQIYTLYVFEVEAYLKSPGSRERIALIADGGQLNDRLQVTYPNFYLERGTEAVLFLNPMNTAEASPEYLAMYPEMLQARPFAGVQGVLGLSAGRMYDIGSDAYYSLPEMLDTLENLTGFSGLQPNGDPIRLEAESTPLQVPGRAITNLADGSGSIPSNGFIAGTDVSSNELIISGSNFGANEGVVLFPNADDGGATFVAAPVVPSDLIYWTDTEIRIKIPTGAGSGTLVVQNSNGSAVGSASIPVFYDIKSIYTNFLNFGTEVIFVPKLAELNNSGGYTLQYNSTQPNTSSDFAGNAEATASFERALITWRCGTGLNFGVDDSGTTAIAPAMDGECVIAFDQLATGTLGVTNSYYQAFGNSSCDRKDTRWHLDNTDIRFNNSINWNYGPGPTMASEYDFESVALHELGHAHGLGHLIDGTNTEVMHYAISTGLDLRNLSNSDQDAGDFMMAVSTAQPCLTPPDAMVSVAASCAALPVELLHFRAEKSEGQAILEWSTATELNNDYFTLERSTDGIHYEPLQQVPGKGTTQERQDYTYTDAQPAPGLNYYRLWQTDFDGQRTKVGLQSLRFSGASSTLEVQQNAASGQLTVIFRAQSAGAGNLQLNLLDIKGRSLLQQSHSYSGTAAQMTLQMPNWPAGVYIVQVQDGRELYHERFVMR